MYSWPSSLVLASFLWSRKKILLEERKQEATLIELGAGTALPGLLAGLVCIDRLILLNILIAFNPTAAWDTCIYY